MLYIIKIWSIFTKVLEFIKKYKLFIYIYIYILKTKKIQK